VCRSISRVFIDIVHCLRQTCYTRISLWTLYGRVVEAGFHSSCFFSGTVPFFKTNVPLSRELSSGHPNVSLFHLVDFSFSSLQQCDSSGSHADDLASSVFFDIVVNVVKLQHVNGVKMLRIFSRERAMFVCATQSVFLISLTISLRMQNFIFGRV
jgi:hypothetical protein